MDAKKHLLKRYENPATRERPTAQNVESSGDASGFGLVAYGQSLISKNFGGKFTMASMLRTAAAARPSARPQATFNPRPGTTIRYAKRSWIASLGDKLNINTVKQALKRDFLLGLFTGFLYDCLEYAIRKFDGAEFRAKVLGEFSGSLCVNVIHLGHRVVLLSSDPVADNPIACALVSKNDAAHMLRFLRNLKNHGFSPETVISDRSPLYPKAIAGVM